MTLAFWKPGCPDGEGVATACGIPCSSCVGHRVGIWFVSVRILVLGVFFDTDVGICLPLVAVVCKLNLFRVVRFRKRVCVCVCVCVCVRPRIYLCVYGSVALAQVRSRLTLWAGNSTGNRTKGPT